MNYQLRGFRFSFIVHTALLLLIIALNSSMVRFSKPVVIDFSIEDSSVKNGPKTSPAPTSEEVRARKPEQLKPQSVLAKQEPIPQQASQQLGPQQVTATSETAAESQAPVSASRSSASVQSAAGSSSATANISKAEGKASPSHGQGNSADEMKQSYLKEHFAYIRNIVQQKLSYPKIARKMGWAGKVIISFIVCTDGHARDITIREGSGIELLDKHAVVAVQNASPFPRPPVEAQLTIPISYRLD